LKTQYRKIFLLTTNRTWINDNLLNRPGRIRYVKNFRDLDLNQINEIIDDCLVNKEWREQIVAFLKPLEIITVDIVKAVISEVNIYNENPFDCCKHLNVKVKEEEWQVIKLDARGKEKEILSETVHPSYIQQALNKNTSWRGRYLPTEDEDLYFVDKPDYDNKIYLVSANSTTKDKSAFKIKLKKIIPTHRSFVI